MCVVYFIERKNRTMSVLEGDLKYAMMDEKKRKRMISNKESAKRSRIKKQKLVQDLTFEASKLQVSNNGIVDKIDAATKGYMMHKAENNVLRAQAVELSERLRYLNDVIANSGIPTDIVDMPNPLMRPWQIPCPMQPIAASSGMLWF